MQGTAIVKVNPNRDARERGNDGGIASCPFMKGQRGQRQRRIFIFGAPGYFKLGALLEGRGGGSHIFRHRFRSCS